MKHLYQILFALLLFVSLPVCLHAERDYFEGFSLTVSLTQNYYLNKFKDVPIEKPYYTYPVPGTDYTLVSDPIKYYDPGLEVSMAYNWRSIFMGLSGFGFQPKRENGEYTIDGYSSNSGQHSSSSPVPFYIDQYTVGALVELGTCSFSQDWVYSGTNTYAKTTYGNPTFHMALGIGRYYKSVKSDVPEYDGTSQGWIYSARFQYLIVWGLGLEISAKMFGYNTMTLGAGIFYKIF